MLVKDYARIHWQNLANFGVLALEYVDPDDHERLEQGDTLTLRGLHELVDSGNEVTIEVTAADGTAKDPVRARHTLSDRQRAHVRAGGTIQWMAARI